MDRNLKIVVAALVVTAGFLVAFHFRGRPDEQPGWRVRQENITERPPSPTPRPGTNSPRPVIVRVAHRGNGLPSVEVTRVVVSPKSGWTLSRRRHRTDAAGMLKLLLKNGHYRFRLDGRRTGYYGAVEGRMDAVADRLDLVLKAHKALELTGKLLDPRGNPMVYSSVTVRRGFRVQTVRTSPDGTFRFRGLDRGDYTLEVVEAPYLPHRQTVRAGSPVAVHYPRRVPTQIYHPRRVHVRVVDPGRGPAPVLYFRRGYRPDAKGGFTVWLREGGRTSFELVASRSPWYVDRVEGMPVKRGRRITVVLRRRATLRGIVTLEGRAPRDPVAITLVSEAGNISRSTVTDAKGDFTLANAPSGKVTLWATARLESMLAGGPHVGWTLKKLELKGARMVNVELRRAAPVFGRLVIGKTTRGEPLPAVPLPPQARSYVLARPSDPGAPVVAAGLLRADLTFRFFIAAGVYDLGLMVAGRVKPILLQRMRRIDRGSALEMRVQRGSALEMRVQEDQRGRPGVVVPPKRN